MASISQEAQSAADKIYNLPHLNTSDIALFVQEAIDNWAKQHSDSRIDWQRQRRLEEVS